LQKEAIMPANEEGSEVEIYDEDETVEELGVLSGIIDPVLTELWDNEKDAEYDRVQ
jgi:hypothetical protein